MRQADFVHLHVHSAYSLLQSTIRLPQLVKRARDYRLPALAVTDHGNLFGCIEFYDLAYSHGIKPIIGCELAVGSDETEPEQVGISDSANHLVLLARNQRGYQNLLQLITHAHARGWQPEPRVTPSQLREHRQGLIVLSGCLWGEIPILLLKEDLQRARIRAAEYLEVFGREYFFIELQPPLTEPQRLLNERLIKLARQLDLQVVATANSHTLDPGESEMVRILAAIRLGTSVEEVPPALQQGFYSPEEMKAEFEHLPEAIAATIAIAERCNLDLDLGRIHLPRFPVEKGQDVMAVLRQQATEGFQERLSTRRHDNKFDYSQRLDNELKAIEKLGLADYFLVIADFVEFARKRGVPVGPGSGSAGSSLTAYALGITEIDPLHHDLMFERLLNPLSPEFPDVDLGFGKEMREEVHQYLRSKYGQDRVAQIVSLVTMQSRTAIRDLDRVLAAPQEDLEANVASIGMADRGEMERKTLETLAPAESPAKVWRRVSELAAILEGLPRQVSTHPTGLIIGDGPLVQRIPLYRGPKDEWVSQYNMRALKRVGLVKFDLIARKPLTVIRKTLGLIGAEIDFPADLEGLPWDDEKAFDLLCRGKIGGIPYLESARARDLLLKWQPREWPDLLTLLVLLRPPALESGLTERFLQARQDEQSLKLLASPLEQELADWPEFLLFDVDLAKLIARITGWSLEKADQLFRLIMKADEEQAESLSLEFIEEATGRGYKLEAAETIWAKLEYSAGLVASKSKTVAQAITVLQAAFLKARFPEHYMAALMSSELRQHDLLTAHVEACRLEGLTLLPPDINSSEVEFTVETEGIRIGLAAIRQVSQPTAAAIVQIRRERGPFHNLFELCTSVEREHLGKRGLTALIKAGALDAFHCPRQQMLEMLPEVMEQARLGQMALFDSCDEEPHSIHGSAKTTEWDESTRLAREKEVLGFYLSGHPLSEFRTLLEALAPGGTARLRNFAEDSQSRLGGIVEQIRVISSRKREALRFLRVEDFTGFLEVVVFADVYQACERYIAEGALILASGRVAREGGQVRLVADEIMSLEEAAVHLAKSFRVHLAVEGLSAQELRELQQILNSHLGSCPVYLHLNIGQEVEVVQELPPPWGVRPLRKLTTRLVEAFGEGCVEVCY